MAIWDSLKDKKYGHALLLYREDTEMAVLATWKKGINNIPGKPVVLPEKITWEPKINMEQMIALKETVKASGNQPEPYQVDLLRYYQWAHVNDVFNHPLQESYQAKVIDSFTWKDWVDPTKVIPNPHERTDIQLKNYPYRERPVQEPKGLAE